MEAGTGDSGARPMRRWFAASSGCLGQGQRTSLDSWALWTTAPPTSAAPRWPSPSTASARNHSWRIAPCSGEFRILCASAASRQVMLQVARWMRHDRLHMLLKALIPHMRHISPAFLSGAVHWRSLSSLVVYFDDVGVSCPVAGLSASPPSPPPPPPNPPAPPSSSGS